MAMDIDEKQPDSIRTDDGRNAHVHRILRALDVSIAAAARGRDINACLGLDDDGTPCEIGSLHTTAGNFAHALGTLIADPHGYTGAAHEALATLIASLQEAFTPLPPSAAQQHLTP